MNALYCTGKHYAFGFSPFAVESGDEESIALLTSCYEMLSRLEPLILEKKEPVRMTAFRLDTQTQTTTFRMGDFVLRCGHTWTLPWSPAKDPERLPAAGALLIHLSPKEFVVAGMGVYIAFESVRDSRNAGILSIQEGTFQDGEWTAGRTMNGDESHQGRHLRLEYGSFTIQRVRLYTYS